VQLLFPSEPRKPLRRRRLGGRRNAGINARGWTDHSLGARQLIAQIGAACGFYRPGENQAACSRLAAQFRGGREQRRRTAVLCGCEVARQSSCDSQPEVSEPALAEGPSAGFVPRVRGWPGGAALVRLATTWAPRMARLGQRALFADHVRTRRKETSERRTWRPGYDPC
jgi:hypothetical protein